MWYVWWDCIVNCFVLSSIHYVSKKMTLTFGTIFQNAFAAQLHYKSEANQKASSKECWVHAHIRFQNAVQLRLQILYYWPSYQEFTDCNWRYMMWSLPASSVLCPFDVPAQQTNLTFAPKQEVVIQVAASLLVEWLIGSWYVRISDALWLAILSPRAYFGRLWWCPLPATLLQLVHVHVVSPTASQL